MVRVTFNLLFLVFLVASTTSLSIARRRPFYGLDPGSRVGIGPGSLHSLGDGRLAVQPKCTISAGRDTIQGKESNGGCRYTVRYGVIPERWAYSYIARNVLNQTTTELPPSCSQAKSDLNTGVPQSEDCLYAIIYTPPTVPRNAPVFVWIHGGSFISGSASSPGLDATKLAVRGKMVVVVLQYRLGVLGFLPPTLSPSSSDPNLGLIDVVNGLKAINMYIQYFGGDQSKVTVGGQSSGAGMIRSLLGAPSAMRLFRGAILQSDPMTYGLASPGVTGQLRDALYSSGSMSGCRSLACYQSTSLNELLDAQEDLVSYAPFSIQGVPLAEVIRPTYQTSTVPFDPTASLSSDPSTLFFSPKSLPLLITTTRNEGGSAVQAMFPNPLPASNATLLKTLAGLVGEDRASKLANADARSYALDGNSGDAFRETLERIITDGTWRCPNRDVAAKWAESGGKVWLGEFVAGTTYPTNKDGEYCTKAGRVCHEDDVIPTFGGGSSGDSVIDMWISFITNLDPGRNWKRFTDGRDGIVKALGGDGPVDKCPPGVWGSLVPYDWQLYR